VATASVSPTNTGLLSRSAAGATTSDVRTGSYDPLRIGTAVRPSPLEATAHNAGRHRDIPLRVYLPTSTTAAPVVLFSHGLGGARTGTRHRPRGSSICELEDSATS
jgi:predicted dienelactone hydrolase